MKSTPLKESKFKILVVEDEAIVARDICLQLGELGYDPVADTPSGEEAVELAKRLCPDLVLMDINLVGQMDGISAATIIRTRWALPVIFLTAFSSVELVKRAKEAQPYGYLVKPFGEQELRISVEMAVHRHRSETRLRESEARYRALTESAQDGIVTVDTEGAVVGWNRGATEMFGYEEAEIVGQPVTILMPSRFHSSELTGIARVQVGGKKHVIGQPSPEVVGLKQDGTEFPLELSMAEWATAEGKFVTAVIRDVSARKKIEEQVQLQSAALSAAINSVVITDVYGTIQWVNPAFCRITGYTFEEAVGQNPRVLKSGHQPKEYYVKMWHRIASGKSWSGEFINRNKDGTLFTESVSITPVRNTAGKIAHYIAIKQDITALKRTLADLRQAHTELSAQNVVLDQALVEANAAAEAKAAFLSTMSHELRTPMNGVIGMTSLLRETEPLTDEQKDYIDTITSSGNSLLSLINDVLDYSKIEARQMEIERFPFDLRRSIEEMLEIVAVRAREKYLDVAVEIDPAVPAMIVGDIGRLRQVLTNLVGNGIKFTSEGEVVVEVRSESVEPGKHRLFFRVRDTGIGIPPDKVERLFKLFSQVDTSTTRVYGGTGLGLAISQRLVELMGGKIEVTSEPDVGSVFFFDIEVTEADSSEVFDPSQVSKDLANRSVLIVDDNATNQRIFSGQLALARCHTAVASSGGEALEWLKGHAWPDVIITDMLMPEMDGLDFTLKLRELEKVHQITPAIPVILVSSGGFQPSDPRVQRAGLAAALSKPLRRVHLLETVARACRATPQRCVIVKRTAASEELRQTATQYPRKILLAEDNPVNRKLALAMLSHLGYQADVVENGLRAVDACRGEDYDLVLMDVQMPIMDGLEAARHLRQLPDPQPMVIAMTANAMEGDRESCLAAGMNGYLSKPVKLNDLRETIISSIRSTQSPRPPSAL